MIPSVCQRWKFLIPTSKAILLQIVQYGSPALVIFPSWSRRIKYKSEPGSWSEADFKASRMALCSAWIQQVLSVTFLWYCALSQRHLLWDSKFCAGELKPFPMMSPSFTMIHQHFDLSQLAFCAISAACCIKSSACVCSGPIKSFIFMVLKIKVAPKEFDSQYALQASGKPFLYQKFSFPRRRDQRELSKINEEVWIYP